MEAQGPLLFAFRAFDGWGIATEGNDVLLVRPPYGKRRPDVCHQPAEKAAAATPGFVQIGRRFRGWGYMFDHMSAMSVAFAVRIGIAGAQDPANDLLRRIDAQGATAVLDVMASPALGDLDPLVRAAVLGATRTSSGVYVNARMVERIDDMLSRIDMPSLRQQGQRLVESAVPQAAIA